MPPPSRSSVVPGGGQDPAADLEPDVEPEEAPADEAPVEEDVAEREPATVATTDPYAEDS